MCSTQTAFVTAVGVHRATWPRSCLANTTYRRSRTNFVTHVQEVQRVTRNPRAVIRASVKPQQQTDWNNITVLDVITPCEEHTLLRVNVGITFEVGSMCDSYRVPGMFVQLRPADAEDRNIKPGFFAISSPPTISGVFEFLIKDSPNTDWITTLRKGDIIQSSPVKGKGFSYFTLQPPPADVLLFATGSGIAPIRASIESVLNGIYPRKRRSVTLYYGARTPQVMAYRDRFQLWSDLNVNVVPVISRPDNSDIPWDGRTGYVQHALADTGVKDPTNTAALLCGVKGMSEEVKAALLETGVPESNILFNY